MLLISEVGQVEFRNYFLHTAHLLALLQLGHGRGCMNLPWMLLFDLLLLILELEYLILQVLNRDLFLSVLLVCLLPHLLLHLLLFKPVLVLDDLVPSFRVRDVLCLCGVLEGIERFFSASFRLVDTRQHHSLGRST